MTTKKQIYDIRQFLRCLSPLRMTLWIMFLYVSSIGNAVAVGSIDNVYYSASNCTPASEGGLRWSFSKGGWYNFHQDDFKWLICPIPYHRDGNNLDYITVRIVVDDRHNSTNGWVNAVMCRQSAFGDPYCSQGSSVTTSVSFIGTEVLETGITPLSSTRWIYVQIGIADVDSNDGRSGVKGYRVER